MFKSKLDSNDKAIEKAICDFGKEFKALGNPFGLDQALTTSIVNALGINGFGIEAYEIRI